jgi:hypothetical protein
MPRFTNWFDAHLPIGETPGTPSLSTPVAFARVPTIFSPCSNPVFAAYGGYLPVPEDMKTDVEYSWNLGVQPQINPSWFVSATYLGNHIVQIWDGVELNLVEYIPGNCAAGEYGLTAPGPYTNSPNINQPGFRI